MAKTTAQTKAPAPPSLSIRRAGDVDRKKVKIKALIYGKSGAGKTHLASQADNAAICLVERQGFATIMDVAPDAAVIGPENDDGVPVLTNMVQVRAFFKMAIRGQLREAGYDTIVVDSITEVQRLMMDEILSEKKQNKDVFSKNDYGTLARRMQAFLRMIRDMDYHVIVLGLADWMYDEESERLIMSPLLKGSVSKEVAGYFNVVGFAYKRQDESPSTDEDDKHDTGVAHYVLVDGDDRYVAKPFGALVGVVRPDWNLWLETLAQGPDGDRLATIDGAPLPSSPTRGERGGTTAGTRFPTSN